MKTSKTQKKRSRKIVALGTLFGAGMTIWVLAGGFVSPGARGSDEVGQATAKTSAAVSGVQPGWASAENDILDLQLD